jgi:hypothetical protein
MQLYTGLFKLTIYRIIENDFPGFHYICPTNTLKIILEKYSVIRNDCRSFYSICPTNTLYILFLKNTGLFQNDCRGFNNFSYTIHFRQQYVLFLFNRTTRRDFVIYLTGTLYVQPIKKKKNQ